MVLVLVGYNAQRLIQFFVFNQTTVAPVKYESLFPKKYKLVRYGLKLGIILYFTISQFIVMNERLDRKYAKNEAPSLTSVYFIKSQTINGKDVAETDIPKSERWKSIFINGSAFRRNSMIIQNTRGTRKYFTTKTDTINKTILFYPSRGEKKDTSTFRYEKLEDKKMRFEGIYQGDTLSIMTQAKAMEDYRLIKSKITWIRDWK